MIEADGQPFLELRGVAKRYGKKQVLEGVDLQLPPGSVLGLLGRNASGKTTLIKCALGLARPQSGEARVFGEPAWTLSPGAKARLGYVPQWPELYEWMRVGQLIDYTASFYPRWNSALVEKLLSVFEVDPRCKVSRLTPGQWRKTSILLALGHEPDLLVLDEPVAGLDPSGRREFLRQLLEVAASGRRSILFSTHITSDLERVADRVVVLKDGRVVHSGPLDSLKDGVKRLHIASPRPLPQDLSFPEALRLEVRGSEALATVRGFTPELAASIERRWDAHVEVEDLNLEDIFLELDHGSAGTRG